MKKLFLTLGLAAITGIGLTGCDKNQPRCSCGTVIEDDVSLNIDGNDTDTSWNCYWLEIENECTFNRDVFCVEKSIWESTYIGNRICLKGQIDIW